MTDVKKKTFEEFDCFNRKPFADKLTKAITTFGQFADGAYVLSLNAPFGSGKTTFLEMWKKQLKNDKFTVLHINAWETDFDEEPLIPIIGEFLDKIEGKGSQKTKNVLKGALGTLALVGNKYLETKIGVDAHSICKEVESKLKAGDLRKLGDELYKSYSFKKKAYEEVKTALAKYVLGLEKSPLQKNIIA